MEVADYKEEHGACRVWCYLWFQVPTRVLVHIPDYKESLPSFSRNLKPVFVCLFCLGFVCFQPKIWPLTLTLKVHD